jgi:hypothetical protein
LNQYCSPQRCKSFCNSIDPLLNHLAEYSLFMLVESMMTPDLAIWSGQQRLPHS